RCARSAKSRSARIPAAASRARPAPPRPAGTPAVRRRGTAPPRSAPHAAAPDARQVHVPRPAYRRTRRLQLPASRSVPHFERALQLRRLPHNIPQKMTHVSARYGNTFPSAPARRPLALARRPTNWRLTCICLRANKPSCKLREPSVNTHKLKQSDACPIISEMHTSAVKAKKIQQILRCGDARDLNWVPDSSVHLVLTSPPYWTLKEYPKGAGQLGFISDYDQFQDELDKVWRHCLRVLVPGGRLICVVGDVCLSRKKHGRHMVMPLHADIVIRCRKIGFDNLTPIFWYKISNAKYEIENGSGFLGKPYEPNAIIKNDVEFILMLRNPGDYRQPTEEQRISSKLTKEEHHEWFQQV